MKESRKEVKITHRDNVCGVGKCMKIRLIDTVFRVIVDKTRVQHGSGWSQARDGKKRSACVVILTDW